MQRSINYRKRTGQDPDVSLQRYDVRPLDQRSAGRKPGKCVHSHRADKNGVYYCTDCGQIINPVEYAL